MHIYLNVLLLILYISMGCSYSWSEGGQKKQHLSSDKQDGFESNTDTKLIQNAKDGKLPPAPAAVKDEEKKDLNSIKDEFSDLLNNSTETNNQDENLNEQNNTNPSDISDNESNSNNNENPNPNEDNNVNDNHPTPPVPHEITDLELCKYLVNQPIMLNRATKVLRYLCKEDGLAKLRDITIYHDLNYIPAPDKNKVLNIETTNNNSISSFFLGTSTLGAGNINAYYQICKSYCQNFNAFKSVYSPEGLKDIQDIAITYRTNNSCFYDFKAKPIFYVIKPAYKGYTKYFTNKDKTIFVEVNYLIKPISEFKNLLTVGIAVKKLDGNIRFYSLKYTKINSYSFHKWLTPKLIEGTAENAYYKVKAVLDLL